MCYCLVFNSLTKGQVHVNNGMFQRCASLTVTSHIGESRAATRAFALLSPSTRNRASRPQVFVSHDTREQRETLYPLDSVTIDTET